MPTPVIVPNDVYAHYGRQLLKHSALWEKCQASVDVSIPVVVGSKPRNTTPLEPVGILGAGIGGLYTALILEDLGIPFKIIEARERVGGRLYTHTFPNPTGAPYNYFDVGAMRFPKISSMRRVFDLFDYKPLNTGDLTLKAKLNPFYFVGAANNDTLLSYNNVTIKQNAMPDPSQDPFHASAVILDTDPGPYIKAGVKAIMDDVIGPYASEFLQDLEVRGRTKGWDKLLSVDKYSTRAYMTIAYEPSPELGLPKGPLPTDVVNWLEAFDKSTGWYDRGFVETVLESVAFGWNPIDDPMVRTEWFCIDGGAFQLADVVYRYIRSQQPAAIAFNKRVTGIALSSDKTTISVTTDNYEVHNFPHVITTIPLPVLRSIDLKQAGLSPMQANAVRQLNYGPSIKIGMQFRTAWWTTSSDKDGSPLNIIGGQTYTDSPLRTVVYPSFGDVKAGKTTTLIASYCWTEDSERLASLIANDKKVLERMVLRELADIHNVDLDFLRGQLIDTFSWSWSLDPYAMGAFAFFGPGKFGNVYQALNRPAANHRLHFAGEAISVRHAWVEGALDSAWRAVYELLLNEGYREYLPKFFQNWGYNTEWNDDKETVVVKSAPVKDQPSGPMRQQPPISQLPVPELPIHKPLFDEVPGMPPPGESGPVDVLRVLESSLLVKLIEYADDVSRHGGGAGW